jgi:hypothetical protein
VNNYTDKYCNYILGYFNVMLFEKLINKEIIYVDEIMKEYEIC